CEDFGHASSLSELFPREQRLSGRIVACAVGAVNAPLSAEHVERERRTIIVPPRGPVIAVARPVERPPETRVRVEKRTAVGIAVIAVARVAPLCFFFFYLGGAGRGRVFPRRRRRLCVGRSRG